MNPFNYISEYLRGELSAKQKAAFEDALANSEDLQTSVKQQRALHDLADSIDMDLREFISARQKQTITEKTGTPKTVARKKSSWLLLLSLVLTGSTIVCFYIFNQGKEPINTTEVPQESIFSPSEKDSITTLVDTVYNHTTPTTPPNLPSVPPSSSVEGGNTNGPEASIEKDKYKICIDFAKNTGEAFLKELKPKVMGQNDTFSINLNNHVALLDSLLTQQDQLNAVEKMSLGYLLFLNKDYLKAIQSLEEVAQQSMLYGADANYLEFIIMAAFLPKNASELKQQFTIVSEYGGSYAQQAAELLQQLY